jgi:phage/plasmid-associated DNA primase
MTIAAPKRYRHRPSSVENTETEDSTYESNNVMFSQSQSNIQTPVSNRSNENAAMSLSQRNLSNASPIPLNLANVAKERALINSKLEHNPEEILVEEVVDLGMLASIIINLTNVNHNVYNEIKTWKIGRDVVTKEQFITDIQKYFYSFKAKEVVINNVAYIKGTRDVLYKQKPLLREGRFQAQNGDSHISLQNLYRKVRHAVQDTFAIDLDFSACHLVLMQHLQEEYDFSWPLLQDYIENKKNITQEIIENEAAVGKIINKDDVKHHILSVVNGGGGNWSFQNPTGWWLEYLAQGKVAVEKIAKKLIESRPEYEYKYDLKCKESGTEGNRYGSIVNNVLCDLENKCCYYMRNFLQERGYKITGICHDGVLVLRNNKLPQITPHILRHCSNYIKHYTNIELDIVIKAPDEAIAVSQDELDSMHIHHPIFDKPKNYNDKYIIQQCLLSNNNGLSELLVNHFKDTVVILDGDIYIYDKAEAIYSYVDNIEKLNKKCMDYASIEVKYFIDEAEKEIQKLLTDGGTKDEIKEAEGEKKRWLALYQSVNSKTYMSNSLATARVSFERKGMTMNSNGDYLPLKHRNIIHLPTLSIRKRTQFDYYTFYSPCKYIPHNGERTEKVENFLSELTSEYYKNKTDNKPVQQREFYQWLVLLLGVFITGQLPRKIFQLYGQGLNGKSCIDEILYTILTINPGGYNTIPDNSILLDVKNKGNSSGHNAGLLLFADNCRVCVYNEPDNTAIYNTSLLKAISSGEPLVGRKPYERKAKTFTTHSKILIISNYKIKYNSEDTAFTDRLVFIEFKERFEKNAKNKAYCKDIIHNHTNELFSIIARGAQRYYQDPDSLDRLPAAVALSTSNLVHDNDELGQFIKSMYISKHSFINDNIPTHLDENAIQVLKETRATNWKKMITRQGEINHIMLKCQNKKFKHVRFENFMQYIKSHFTQIVDKQSVEKTLIRMNLIKMSGKYTYLQEKVGDDYQDILFISYLKGIDKYCNTFENDFDYDALLNDNIQQQPEQEQMEDEE